MYDETIKVSAEHEKTRIDRFLGDRLDLSRSRIQTLVTDGDILVNGDVVKSNYRLKEDDEIMIHIPENEEYEVLAEDIPIDIVYEDDDVMVVNKPKGMVVHPAPGNLHGTLVNAILYHCKDLSGINGVLRPGIVHRIDKDTSGLLIIAKNDKAHQSLSEQLQSKTVSRKYYALVHGEIPHEYGTIDAPIGRDVKDRKRMCVCEQNSKDAVTHFRVIERFDDYTLIECSLETGRTHQIRVHMKYIKFPIVGDETYSYKKTMDTSGQLLHAYELEFTHPTTGEKVVVQADMPDVFKEVLEELRKE
ncbi:RluA family pseudouridine synthase [Breznakia pachnodae]|uniref:Pseudouridine synthase n=1 Tax=Breznakia pachnodae TaxID=265178 RepID=A0ABU0E447_9FIRM|nr:RluA family pseudouridine synthase [Breznakia pachnodae]MDQ0361660.1 23S rRNA pseudouridine1911/1915/1917 synthase [Breznakia pachnodae]